MYAIIAGGGKVGFFLARELIEHGHEVLIVENNSDRAEFIANELGNVVLRGIRLCEPCDHLESLTVKGIKDGLHHRGGLRAQVVQGGTLRAGDVIRLR